MQTLTKIHSKFQELKKRLREINHLECAAALLYWDQATYMPPGGARARGEQLATLDQIAHEKFISEDFGELLESLSSYENSLPYESDQASLIRLTRRKYEKAIRVPAEFIARLSKHQTRCYEIWARAKAENNFSVCIPYLEKTLTLSREYADFFPGYEHIADPLIERADHGTRTSTVRKLFHQLRQELVPLVEEIATRPIIDDSCLHQHYSEEEQLDFTLKVIRQLGYDFQRGRQDKTHHPFMIPFSIGDVRITTRVYENNLDQALFSTIHEMGHALYEQGINLDYEGTPLASGTSSGVHESQARLWENMIGRSRGFWQFFYPQLQAEFPGQLKNVSLDSFYRAVNKVKRSPIRTDADEVTYNLHVMIRFDLEIEMLEGNLEIKDLPQAWNDRYQSDLGITPVDDAEGVLQDLHWYTGKIGGMFQGYTLGNLIAAQFYEAAIAAEPEIPTQVAEGDFSTLNNWLRHNIHQHGKKYTPQELIKLVTGKDVEIEPFIKYIKNKYSELYRL